MTEPTEPQQPFDSEAWFERLHALNPWVRAQGLELPGPEDFGDFGHGAGEAFRTALRAECMRRYKAGKEEWNRWAEGMLALQAELETAGKWNVERRLRPVKGKYIFLLQAEGAESAALVALSQGDFHRVEFETDADFEGFTFPGEARFVEAQFSADAWFGGAQFSADALFGAAQFSGAAGFDKAQFSGDARFGEAQFSGAALFAEAQFSGAALFAEAQFSADALFGAAQFSADALFGAAQFSGAAGFGKAVFLSDVAFQQAVFAQEARFAAAQFADSARFDGARFEGQAWFPLAQFKGPTVFAKAQFKGPASFEACQGKEGSSFSLADATFDQVPDFIQASFQKAPRLDNVRVGVGALKRDKDMAARWRALRGLAIDGHDHEREMQFFAGEVKAQRFVEDFPYPWWRPFPLQLKKSFPWIGRRMLLNEDGEVTDHKASWRPSWGNVGQFYFGWLFQLFSDFSRSMFRPLLWWVGSVLLCAALYFSAHLEARQSFPAEDPAIRKQSPAELVEWTKQLFPPTACIAGEAGHGVVGEALYLSTVKGLVFTGLAGGARTPQSYACLYGVHEGPRAEGVPPRPAKVLPDNFTPRVPTFVSVIAIFQLLFSLTLITLFLLALRNHFRIR